MKPAQKHAVVQFFRVGFQVSEHRACQVVVVRRSSCRYRIKLRTRRPRGRRLESAAERVHFGYRPLFVLLQCEGRPVNHQRVHRHYRGEGLSIRAKQQKRRVSLRGSCRR